MKTFNDDDLEILEENILEEIEYLETTEGDSVECISLENLEEILTRFFNRKITLKNNK